MSHAPLDAATVIHLHTVLDACQRQLPVQWSADGGDSVREGVARRISPFDGTTNTDAADVRDQFLHISGFVELWLPMSEVLALVKDGEMVFRDRAVSR